MKPFTFPVSLFSQLSIHSTLRETNIHPLIPQRRRVQQPLPPRPLPILPLPKSLKYNLTRIPSHNIQPHRRLNPRPIIRPRLNQHAPPRIRPQHLLTRGILDPQIRRVERARREEQHEATVAARVLDQGGALDVVLVGAGRVQGVRPGGQGVVAICADLFDHSIRLVLCIMPGGVLEDDILLPIVREAVWVGGPGALRRSRRAEEGYALRDEGAGGVGGEGGTDAVFLHGRVGGDGVLVEDEMFGGVKVDVGGQDVGVGVGDPRARVGQGVRVVGEEGPGGLEVWGGCDGGVD